MGDWMGDRSLIFLSLCIVLVIDAFILVHYLLR